jgi:CheY-like chemotaxis protein
MPDGKASVLIVDDDDVLRKTLSAILAASGYLVRSAKDGFSALVELRHALPDIIVSDLNMPGMSGFEFLSVVRRRFPRVQAIAMSGAHAGEQVPSGVAAEAFYAKGSNIAALLRMVDAMSRPERPERLHHPSAAAPIWIPNNGYNSFGEPYVVITCLECLRTFAQAVDEAGCPVHEAACVYCRSLIYYAIVQSTDLPSAPMYQRQPGAGMAPSSRPSES